MKRTLTLRRQLTAVVGAGMLFQTGGCMIDTNALFAQLATSVIQNVLATFIFGAFNLVP